MIFSALIFSWNDTKYAFLINLFIIIMIELYSNLVIDFLNFDSLMIKFIVIDYHDLFDTLNNCSFLYNLYIILNIVSLFDWIIWFICLFVSILLYSFLFLFSLELWVFVKISIWIVYFYQILFLQILCNL